jgi:hypothetical protein
VEDVRIADAGEEVWWRMAAQLVNEATHNDPTMSPR